MISMKETTKFVYRKQGYYIIGNHSAVKLCHWLRMAMLGKGYCYKQKFYGIKSHRCLQMTPSLPNCTHRCIFCWRAVELTENEPLTDGPQFIVEESIKAQRKLIVGYKGDPRVTEQIFEEAMNPNQVAISLAGEPTMYPKLEEMIKEYHRHGFTTFVVTNGTFPDVIRKIRPTQLYISLIASNKDMYNKVARPIGDTWDRFLESLELFPSVNTRRVIRMTMVKGWNMSNIDEYAKLIRKANPHFVEVKAYMRVGYSRDRLPDSAMPSHDEILTFTKKLGEKIGYQLLDDKKESRVTLLSKEDYKWRSLEKEQPTNYP